MKKGFEYGWVFNMKTDTLLYKSLPKQLKRYGYDPVLGSDFIYASGDIPVLLVAHVDTVFHMQPDEIYYDKKKQVMWSPQGLGADDRAGVAGILRLLSMGYKPHVLFTDKEEKGGAGAASAVKSLSKDNKPKVNFIIQLDRRGVNDAVFYDCDNRDFAKLIKSFGFEERDGSFSDISILCPSWGIAGVNLSIGYLREHREVETFFIDAWNSVINKVAKILDHASISNEQYEYIEMQIPNVVSFRTGAVAKEQKDTKTKKYKNTKTKETAKGQAKISEHVHKAKGGNNEEIMFSKHGIVDYNSWYGEVKLTIDAFTLSDIYGGDFCDWESWIEDNKEMLLDRCEEDILKTIERIIGACIPQFFL